MTGDHGPVDDAIVCQRNAMEGRGVDRRRQREVEPAGLLMSVVVLELTTFQLHTDCLGCCDDEGSCFIVVGVIRSFEDDKYCIVQV